MTYLRHLPVLLMAALLASCSKGPKGDPGPKGAAKAAEWKYGTEVFKFKGSKLAKEKK